MNTGRRIAVIGCPGSGKTVLATCLAERTGLPLHHLDDLYWQEDWRETPPEEWRGIVARLVAQDAWIIDGHYASTVEMRLAAADTVVLLDPPTLVCVARVLWRTVRRRLGVDTPLPLRIRAVGRAQPVSKDFLSFLKLVVTFRRTARPKILALLGLGPSGQRVVILRGARDRARFLASLARGPGP